MRSTARPALRGLGVLLVVLGVLTAASVALFTGQSAVAATASGASQSRLAAAGTDPVVTSEQTVQVGDDTRYYLLGGAPAVTGGRAPLLLLFHGLDQATTDFLGDVNILGAAAAAGVIVAAPESPDDSWNDGRFGTDGEDDDAFAMAVIDQLTTDGAIDPARVTVAGFSNGAGMAMEVASRHPSQVAALVSVDGEIISGPDQTLPSGPVPAYFVHGTNDPVQPIDGRLYTSDRYPGQISEQDTINAFLAVDGEAGAVPTQAVAVHHKALTVGSVTVTQWAQPGAVPVLFASVAGMGHKWPELTCTQVADSAALMAKLTTAQKTSVKVKALQKRLLHTHQKVAKKVLRKQLVALQKLATKQTRAAAVAKAAATLAGATATAAIAAMVPSDGITGCETGGGENTRATDFSANGLVLGVAASAHQGSYNS